MFGKEESAKIRQEFWTSFGKSFPKKWILYNTEIKGVSLKFVADRKKAMVCLDIENSDESFNELIFDQIKSLKKIMSSEYLQDVFFDDSYELETGKTIRRIYINHNKKFSIYNKNTWRDCYEFFVETMTKFEDFILEYQDYI